SQEIAQGAHAAFRGPAALRNRGGGSIAFGDGGEDFQLNGSLHCLGLLIGVYGVEEAFRSGLLMRSYGGHGFLPSVRASSLNQLLFFGVLYSLAPNRRRMASWLRRARPARLAHED